MGMDSVELVLGIEETFGIAITDEQAERMSTPRDVVDFVIGAVPTIEGDRCTTREVFALLRQGLVHTLGVERDELRLDTKISSLVDKKSWPAVWARLRSEFGGPHWPETLPAAGFFRAGPRTLRELLLHVCMAFPAPEAGGPWTREQVEFALRRILREVVGIQAYRSGDGFVDDLRID